MKLGESIRTHYQNLERGVLHVPEWDATVYYKPMTLGMKQKIFRHSDKESKGTTSNFTLFAYACIFMLEDEQGEKVLTLEDKKTLMEIADQDVVTRVGQALFDTDGHDVKN